MKKILFLLMLFPFFSHAQIAVWDGDSDGDGDGLKWGDPQNWVADALPEKKDLVQIAGDSVVVSDEVLISQLELQPGAILTVSDKIFTVEQSAGEGVIIDGSAKLYVTGEMHVLKSALNAIDLQANGSLIIRQEGILYIDDANSSGINGVPGDYFMNEGQLIIVNVAGNGLELNDFTNKGEIQIENIGGAAVIVSGANGLNEGDIYTSEGVSIQCSNSFTNTSSATIRASGTINISCDFLNQGELNARNSSGIGLSLSTNHTLTNQGDIKLRPSQADALLLDNSYELFNEKDGVILLTSAAVGTVPNKYIMKIDGPDTKLTNHGFISLGILGRREGIKVSNRAIIENVGDFYIGDFYEKGLTYEANGLNSVVLINADTAYFKIGKGVLADAVALEFDTRVQMTNAACADFILEDSLALKGSVGMSLTNEGFLQLEHFYKKSNAAFTNSGAIYLADSALALDSPNSIIDKITNTGIVYHPLEAPIISGLTVSPFLRKANFANADLVGNTVFVQNGNGLLTPVGQIITNTNSWTPPAFAVGKDSVFFNYRPNGSGCQLRSLSIPFITFSDCPSPAVLTFTGNVSEDWHTAGNWSSNQVPRKCDDVIIPNGERCEIAPSSIVTAKSILVESGAYFLAPTGIVGLIDPEEGN
ncbi:hypothetical protein [Arcticibacterium luteifluviistationis]|uniref:G8 domain-containing protein n=1 Tax=Arcticibacterium luteifluviistationis TaxID=1784714 RepID=A0A2Z4GHA6_9BACT|nr:hypothetical protein [Arcticibacterium luteifluviistationis]AWW00458.1 hypothetical protein DJ013_20665 [Arcticibacterium luteifluviistationis]